MIVAAAALQFPAWPALFKVLLAYGYAARIPVAIVMFFAIRGNWGTHYDALPRAQVLKPVFVPVSTQAQGTEEEQMFARSKAGQIPVAMEAEDGMVYVVTANGMLYKYATADLGKQAEQRIGVR